MCCEQPRLPQWELPLEIPADANLAVLGWRVQPAPVDAGPPEEFVRVFSEALIRHARVSFFAPAPQRPWLLDRWLSRSRGATRVLIHTSDAGQLRQLFTNPELDWCLRATAAFLSPLDAPAPVLGIEDLERALAGRAYADWRARGISGLVLPGVDGQVLGAYAADASLWRPWKDGLCAAARGRGIEWRDVSEDDFARALAG